MLKWLGALLVPVLMSCEDPMGNLYPEVRPLRLPAETQVGANTFGCLVNGQLWEANNTRTLTGNVLTPKIRFENGTLHVDAFRRLQAAGPVTNFYFTANHVNGPGVYALGAAWPKVGSFAKLATNNDAAEYATDAQHPGTLTITRLDTSGAHPFIAGRFELRAVAAAGTAPRTDLPTDLRITKGRFDIQLERR